jgi:hypothetical protein
MNQKFWRDARNHLQPKICYETTQVTRSGQNKLLRLEKRDELNQAQDKRFNPKFTSTKEAMSLLMIPQREGYHEEPLASPNLHKGRLVFTKNTPQRRGEI